MGSAMAASELEENHVMADVKIGRQSGNFQNLSYIPNREPRMFLSIWLAHSTTMEIEEDFHTQILYLSLKPFRQFHLDNSSPCLVPFCSLDSDDKTQQTWY